MRWGSFAIFALVAAPALAAKPVGPGDGTMGPYRAEAAALCAQVLRAEPRANARDVERVCGCAADRFLDSRFGSGTPRLDGGRLPVELRSAVLRCVGETRPANAVDLISAAMRPAPATPRREPARETAETAPAAEIGEKRDIAEPDFPEESARPAPPSGPGLGERLRGALSRLGDTGIPRWIWMSVGLLILAGIVARRLGGRRRDTDDLMAPPASMRPGGRPPNLPPPRY